MSFEWLYLYLIPFMVMITIVVFVHEFGHYLLARLNGVRVDVFSIGFGPELFGYSNKAGTRWKFSLVPLGGYVKMASDVNAASQPDSKAIAKMTEEEKKGSLFHKTVWQRIQVSAAGPVFNYIFAVLILAVLYTTVGQTLPSESSKLGAVLPDTAAARAGLQPGDEIIAIDGKSIQTFEELRKTVAVNAGQELEFMVRRPGRQLSFTLTPEEQVITDDSGAEKSIGLIGVYPSTAQVKRSFLSSWYYAGEFVLAKSWETIKFLGRMIIGQVSAKGLTGPIGIAKITGEYATVDFATFFWFMAFISMNLGLINLFPIPMLDGGHLLFYFIEAIRGRPLSERAQEYGFRIGFFMVLALMLFATWNDLRKLQVFQKIASLFS
ncbi:MAG: RIP metalloprotease RseP [Pseudomonadota bacterium]